MDERLTGDSCGGSYGLFWRAVRLTPHAYPVFPTPCTWAGLWSRPRRASSRAFCMAGTA